MAEEKKLDKLKSDYAKIQKQYKLPSFDHLNEDFWLEEIAGSETDFLTRKIRSKVADHLSRVARFLESILNPVNASMFVFTLVKLVEPEEKRVLSDIYKKLMKMEIEIIRLDIEFNEQKEAAFIKNYFELWQDAKKDLSKFIESIGSKWDNKSESNTKGYFG